MSENENGSPAATIITKILQEGHQSGSLHECAAEQTSNEGDIVDLSLAAEASKEPSKEYSCTNCRSYFPVLKSFIMHLESSHVKGSVKDGTDKYLCEVCNTEFENSIVLGKHALAHVSEAGNQLELSSDKEKLSLQNETGESTICPVVNQVPRKRGRPKKGTANKEVVVVTNKVSLRKRGRPPKQPRISNQEIEVEEKKDVEDSISNEPAASKDHVDEDTVKQNNNQDVKKNDHQKDKESFALVRPREEQVEEELIEKLTNADSHVLDGCKEKCDIDEAEENKNDEETCSAEAGKINGGGKKIRRTSDRKKRNAENQCIVCLQKFATKEALREHRLSHGDREKWLCNDCQREFSSHWKYHEHCVKFHNNRKPFQCDECGKCLSSFTILATHKGLHSGERPYACDLCGKRYLVAAGLKDHLIAHQNERRHRCENCGAGFNAKGDLKKHLITHMYDKPHNCHICNTGFNRAASLRRHLRSHTGEKPFKCDLCEKSFSRKEKMHEHRRTHTGERPLICPTCNKAFKDSSNFSNHKKIHTSGYVPRRRKRMALKRKDPSALDATTPADVGSPVEAAQQPVSNAEEALAAQKTIEDSALKDFATISMATEGLQTNGQELFRQLFGVALDPNDLRNLSTVQSVAGNAGTLYNLSPIDLRSLQSIINGVQARNPVGSVNAATQNPASENQQK